MSDSTPTPNPTPEKAPIEIIVDSAHSFGEYVRKNRTEFVPTDVVEITEFYGSFGIFLQYCGGAIIYPAPGIADKHILHDVRLRRKGTWKTMVETASKIPWLGTLIARNEDLPTIIPSIVTGDHKGDTFLRLIRLKWIPDTPTTRPYLEAEEKFVRINDIHNLQLEILNLIDVTLEGCEPLSKVRPLVYVAAVAQ